jgi:formate hydrogenlyase subunit 3/multisubunit Na+/H+ antiporter MnhD subunit
MARDVWNRIRAGGPPAVAGLALLLLAAVGDVLVLAGVRFAVQADRASRLILVLLALVPLLAAGARSRSSKPIVDRPAQARVDGWFLLLLGLSLACVTASLLLGPQ